MNMNNELTVWNYGDNDVRILMIDDEPWLVLEYCRTLGEIYDIVIEDMDRQQRGLKG